LNSIMSRRWIKIPSSTVAGNDLAGGKCCFVVNTDVEGMTLFFGRLRNTRFLVGWQKTKIGLDVDSDTATPSLHSMCGLADTQ
jgi:hypothetical protein